MSEGKDSELLKTARRLSLAGPLNKTSLPFSLNTIDFYLDITDVVKGPKIGEGAFSQVYIGRYFGDIVAVKCQTHTRPDLEAAVLRELALLHDLHHPNILSYVGACDQPKGSKPSGNWAPPKDEGCVYLVTEYAAYRDMLSFLQLDIELGWRLRIEMARDAASALAFLHSMKYIHRDIKAENFLVDGNLTVKLCDFGLAREYNPDKQEEMSESGTPSHMAPEIRLDEPYGAEVDVFSFGVFLVEVMTRRRISLGLEDSKTQFLARSGKDLFEMDIDGLRSACEAVNAPASLIELAIQCCEAEAELRPTSKDILEWLDDLLNEIPDDSSSIPPPNIPEVGELGKDVVTRDREAQSGPIASPVKPESTYIQHLAEVNPRLSQQLLPIKRGYLFKRKIQGLRLWRKRWFVLNPIEATLSWYNSKDEEAKGPFADKQLSLKRSVLVRGNHYRFQILRTRDLEVSQRDGSILLKNISENRELAAANPDVLADWLFAIQNVIDLWQGLEVEEVKDSKDEQARLSRNGSVPSAGIKFSQNKKRLSMDESTQIREILGSLDLGETKSEGQTPPSRDRIHIHKRRTSFLSSHTAVGDWLKSLDMYEYEPLFVKAGYASFAQVNSVGLRDEDLDHIGITNPFHRRVLTTMATGHFSGKLRIRLGAHKDFGGEVMYEILSTYHGMRAATLMRFTDIAKMHGTLKVSTRRPGRRKESAPLTLPHLPTKGRLFHNQKSVEFQEKRLKELQQYMENLATAVEPKAHPGEFEIVLRFLRLKWDQEE